VWTEQKVHDLSNTGKRAADFRSSIQAAGGPVKNNYWTMGRYDGVIVFDAPDDATAAAVIMGNVPRRMCAQKPDKFLQQMRLRAY